MLTTNQNIETTIADEAQIETLPSDTEISARVLQIRQSWDLNERIERRDEAERRFSDLINTLTGSTAA